HLLETVPGWSAGDEPPLRNLEAALRRAVATLTAKPTDKRERARARAAVAALSEALEAMRGQQVSHGGRDPALLGLLGRVNHEIWRLTGQRQELVRSREFYEECFTLSGDLFAGAEAAVAAYLLGARGVARKLATAALRSLDAASGSGDDDLPGHDHPAVRSMSQAVMQLLLGQAEAAAASYAEGVALAGRQYQVAVAARRALNDLGQAGLKVPPALPTLLKPPTVVVFTGPPLDRPGQAGPLFPPHLEPQLRAAIEARLDALGGRIGYASAAAGAELLFVEALLERGAEVNLVLPFELEDFVRLNVAPAGPRWERRFRNAIKLADSISFATAERFLGHDMLYRFGNQVLHGIAALRARLLASEPHLLAVWNMLSGSLPGGAADFIDRWGDITRLSIIDIEELNSQHPGPAGDAGRAPDPSPTAVPPGGAQRVIKGMLFADLVGFSKLGEEHMPAFLDFVGRLHARVSGGQHPPEFIKTWGDGIFAVAPRALDIAEFALKLKDAVAQISDEVAGLPRRLAIRISLHAGPVFEAQDPFTGLRNAYGTHINRAARLEPVTVPGYVYATQTLVALLAAEQAELRSEVERSGEGFRERFACDYVGILPLAKGYGREPVYHLHAASP
ncbi:MAG: adenylate/guanylate cyclase domain-containing protein, partial [Alphaproteobacteria bacterium]|nr:adenylate/guanylate cyclase domain-containing protein [Alphaproteobacteria bacterium]